MSHWTGARLGRALQISVPASVHCVGISTDTRDITPGALFVALSGERFDGHDFLGEAEARGARAAVVRRGTPSVPGLTLLEVDDPLVALGQLATERRRQISGPVVAVTGTNGKTATKEMIAAALATRWAVHATRANRNNLVGVPLTILAAPEGADALVVEAGASLHGEIGRLRGIIEPTIAVVTNVSAGHTEGFGSVEGVLREKVSLLEDVPLAVVGVHPPELVVWARQVARRAVVAGLAPPATICPDAWSLDDTGRGELTFRGARVSLPLPGRHQVENAMLALAVAAELGVEAQAAVKALAEVRLPPGRCEVLRHGDLVVLHDAYNANPASVLAALDTANAMRGNRPLVVVLGTMRELGRESAELHAQVAAHVVALRPHVVGAVGAFASAFEPYRPVLGDRLITAPDPDTLGPRLAERVTGHELVLLKASRGVRLERAIPHLIPHTD